MTKPLGGTLVVSLDQAVAAPMTARRLADAGARVIKLERPEGDFARYYDDIVKGQCTHYVWLNRGKESVVADLTKPEDRRLLEAHAGASADVFLQNLKPGALAKLGYPVEASAREAPRADLLLDLGIWRRRSLSRPQGLRSADPGRIRVGFHHRRTRRAGPRRRVLSGYRHGTARVRSNSRSAHCTRPHRARRRHPSVDVRCDDGVDGDTAAVRRARRSAQAHGADAFQRRALRCFPDPGRKPDSHLGPE